MFSNKKCANHPSKAALSFCHCCKEFFCEDCLAEGVDDYYYCLRPACASVLRKLRDDKDRSIRNAYAHWFCERCLNATTNESSGSLHTINGFGTLFLGSHDQCPVCKSCITTEWNCFFFVPFFPVAKYRVIFGSGNSFFGGRGFVSRRLREK